MELVWLIEDPFLLVRGGCISGKSRTKARPLSPQEAQRYQDSTLAFSPYNAVLMIKRLVWGGGEWRAKQVGPCPTAEGSAAGPGLGSRRSLDHCEDEVQLPAHKE